MSNELTDRQRMILNPENYVLDTRFYKVVDNTLYYRYKWGTWKGQDLYQDRWYPVLTKKGKHWIGYNYSVKPCLATYLLHHPSEFTWRFQKLKWVELGRGIGGKGLRRLWEQQWQEKSILTKVINPTVEMLIKPID